MSDDERSTRNRMTHVAYMLRETPEAFSDEDRPRQLAAVLDYLGQATLTATADEIEARAIAAAEQRPELMAAYITTAAQIANDVEAQRSSLVDATAAQLTDLESSARSSGKLASDAPLPEDTFLAIATALQDQSAALADLAQQELDQQNQAKASHDASLQALDTLELAHHDTVLLASLQRPR